MEPKKILKIRLRPDGTWENVYEEESLEYIVNELEAKLTEFVSLYELQDAFIEQALELSDYEESKVVLSHIMQKK
jgi:hypothetical protein